MPKDRRQPPRRSRQDLYDADMRCAYGAFSEGSFYMARQYALWAEDYGMHELDGTRDAMMRALAVLLDGTVEEEFDQGVQSRILEALEITDNYGGFINLRFFKKIGKNALHYLDKHPIIEKRAR